MTSERGECLAFQNVRSYRVPDVRCRYMKWLRTKQKVVGFGFGVCHISSHNDCSLYWTTSKQQKHVFHNEQCSCDEIPMIASQCQLPDRDKTGKWFAATPVARHILQTLYSFTQLQSPRVHLPLSYFSFHVITFHLVHGLSASLPLKFGIPYLFTSGNHNHSPLSDVI